METLALREKIKSMDYTIKRLQDCNKQLKEAYQECLDDLEDWSIIIDNRQIADDMDADVKKHLTIMDTLERQI